MNKILPFFFESLDADRTLLTNISGEYGVLESRDELEAMAAGNPAPGTIEKLAHAKFIASDEITFSPYKSLFMRRHEGPYGSDEVTKKAWKNAINHVYEDYRKGSLQSYYVDSFRAVAGGEVATRWSRFADDL